MIDLHIHTTYSDGTYKPEEIITMAKELHLTQIAITDHNTLNGALEALKYVDDYDFIIGIELPVFFHQKEVHLLGYFPKIQQSFKATKKIIDEGESHKLESQTKMVEKLQHKGLDITYDEVLEAFPHTSINRVHISRILVSKGYVKDVNDGFVKYLGEDKDCYVQRVCPDIKKAIKAIHDDGGLAVIAHPFQYHFNDVEKELLDIIDELDGIEALHFKASPKQREQLMEFAGKYHKLITGGSDFHGVNKPDVPLGAAKVPDQYRLVF